MSEGAQQLFILSILTWLKTCIGIFQFHFMPVNQFTRLLYVCLYFLLVCFKYFLLPQILRFLFYWFVEDLSLKCKKPLAVILSLSGGGAVTSEVTFFCKDASLVVYFFLKSELTTIWFKMINDLINLVLVVQFHTSKQGRQIFIFLLKKINYRDDQLEELKKKK